MALLSPWLLNTAASGTCFRVYVSRPDVVSDGSQEADGSQGSLCRSLRFHGLQVSHQTQHVTCDVLEVSELDMSRSANSE